MSLSLALITDPSHSHSHSHSHLLADLRSATSTQLPELTLQNVQNIIENFTEILLRNLIIKLYAGFLMLVSVTRALY